MNLIPGIKYFLSCSLALFSLILSAQVPAPELLWMRSIGGSASESISSWVLPTPDGGFITRIESMSPAGTGNIDSFCSPVTRRMIFTKYNSNATIVEWSKCFGTQGDSILLFLYPQADGSDIVIGDFKSNGVLIKKYDATGGEVWQQNYSKGMAGFPYTPLQTADGGYVLLCGSHNTDTNVLVHYGSWETRDYWLLKVDSNGNKVWSKVIGGTDEEDRGVLVQGPGTDFYIIGITASTDLDCVGNHGRADVFVARCNDTGGIVWHRMCGGSENEMNVSACSNGAGGLIIACNTSSSDGDVHHFIGGEDYWLLEVDTGGNLLWDNCYGTAGYENATSVCKATDGSIWVNGQTFTPDRDVYLVHIGNSGELLHQRILASTYEDEGQMVFPLSGGKTLVGGYSVNLNGDFAVIPYRGARDVFFGVFAPQDNGVDEQSKCTTSQYRVFPNPTVDVVNIEAKEINTSHQITIINIFGQVVMRSEIQSGSSFISIPTDSLIAGIYNISIVSETGIRFSKCMQVIH
jgi:hypothetical protein